MAKGTVLESPESATISKEGDRPMITLPPNTRITYPNGGSVTRSESFTLVRTSPADAPSANAAWPPASRTITLGDGVRQKVPGSSWGTFTIACTVPIALFVGLYMYRIRKGRVVEASLIGAVATLAATVAGGWIHGSAIEPYFELAARRHDLGDLLVRLHRQRVASLAAALPARLSVELSKNRHGRVIGRRGDCRESETRAAADQSRVCSRRRAKHERTDLSLLLHLHHVRGDFRVSLRWCPPARRPR